MSYYSNLFLVNEQLFSNNNNNNNNNFYDTLNKHSQIKVNDAINIKAGKTTLKIKFHELLSSWHLCKRENIQGSDSAFDPTE